MQKKYVTKINKLTPEQEAQMKPYADYWISKGLQTGETDFETFERYIPLAYEKAGIKFPNKIIRVSSPLVGAVASSVAGKMLNGGAVDDAIDGAVGDAVDDAVGGVVRGAVDDAIDGVVGGAVGGAVRGVVGGAVGGAVRGAVGDAVGGAVRGAIDGAVGGAVYGAVGDAVDDAVGDAVGGAVRGAIGGAVGGAVDSADKKGKELSNKEIVSNILTSYNLKSLNWHWWIGGQFWVGGWYGSPALVNFFFDVCNLKLSDDIMERAEINRKISESAGYHWVNKDFVMVSERPTRISRNAEGQLHNDNGLKAIEWSDGFGIYCLDGIRIDEPETYHKIVSRKMSFTEIMQIEISDIRTVALKYNPQAILAEKSQLLHSDNRNNELYLIENAEINKITGFPKMYFLKMLCPTGRVFIEMIPPEIGEIGDSTEAQAWACGLVKSDYLNMTLES